MCRLSWNLRAWTSWNPQGLSRPVVGLVYLLSYMKNIRIMVVFENCLLGGLSGRKGKENDIMRGLIIYVHISVHHKFMFLKDQRDAILSSTYLLYCQVTLHVSGVSRAHHHDYTNCSYNHWYKSWIWRCNDKIRLKRVHGRTAVAARPWTLFNRILSLHLQIHDLY